MRENRLAMYFNIPFKKQFQMKKNAMWYLARHPAVMRNPTRNIFPKGNNSYIISLHMLFYNALITVMLENKKFALAMEEEVTESIYSKMMLTCFAIWIELNLTLEISE